MAIYRSVTCLLVPLGVILIGAHTASASWKILDVCAAQEVAARAAGVHTLKDPCRISPDNPFHVSLKIIIGGRLQVASVSGTLQRTDHGLVRRRLGRLTLRKLAPYLAVLPRRHGPFKVPERSNHTKICGANILLQRTDMPSLDCLLSPSVRHDTTQVFRNSS